MDRHAPDAGKYAPMLDDPDCDGFGGELADKIGRFRPIEGDDAVPRDMHPSIFQETEETAGRIAAGRHGVLVPSPHYGPLAVLDRHSMGLHFSSVRHMALNVEQEMHVDAGQWKVAASCRRHPNPIPAC